LGGIVGFDPVGFTINILQGVFSPQLVLVFSYKNLYPMALAAILFVIGENILFSASFQEKARQVSSTPLINGKFNALKSIHRTGTVPVMMMNIALVASSPFYSTPFEFPYIPRLLGGYAIWLYILFVYLVLVTIPIYLDWKTYRHCRQILTDTFLPIISREFVNGKPLIQIWDLKKELELQSADRRQFREVLLAAAKMAERREAVHFGVSGN
jgi:hypothetical protein